MDGLPCAAFGQRSSVTEWLLSLCGRALPRLLIFSLLGVTLGAQADQGAVEPPLSEASRTAALQTLQRR